jgi:signal transduction histidine kinase
LNDYLGIATNKLHLSEYYAFKKDTIKAIQYAKETRQLASSTNNFKELLPSLLLLSKLDKENHSKYTTRYIQLNDSLHKEERAIRNKFARIKFETNEIITKNERLNKQKKLILFISGLVFLLVILIYIVARQRVKNKNLKFEQEQQKANEEIYNLMISQQNKLDEGSRKEKKRISEELHDGVLGKLFGTRLILGNLNDSSDKESILKREKHINDLQDIEEEVRNVSHELNSQALISNTSYTQMIDNLLESQSGIINFIYKTKYDKHIIWKEINGDLKMNLYRIIQEAIQNINKYSKAKHVSIEFKIDKSDLSLLIKDDGVGFNTDAKIKGIGLKNMKSRADKLNGKLSINSRNDKGTLIVIIVPLNG